MRTVYSVSCSEVLIICMENISDNIIFFASDTSDKLAMDTAGYSLTIGTYLQKATDQPIHYIFTVAL